MNYRGFKNELMNYHEHLKALSEIKEKMGDLIYQMSGVKGVRYDKITTSGNPEISEQKRLEMIDLYNEYEQDLKYHRESIAYLQRKLSKLSDDDKEICMKVISDGISADKIAREKGYSKSGIWAKIRREISKIM